MPLGAQYGRFELFQHFYEITSANAYSAFNESRFTLVTKYHVAVNSKTRLLRNLLCLEFSVSSTTFIWEWHIVYCIRLS